MSKTTELQIEEMSCGHCVAAVRQALQAIPGVERADVDLTAGKATVVHEETVSTPTLLRAVEDEGYTAR
jgi:copper chaperone